MMKIAVCIGSSCHLKGAREVVEKLQSLIKLHNLEDKLTLSGRFCMGKCQSGVSVEIDGKLYSMNPNNVEEIFMEAVVEPLVSSIKE